MDNLYHDLLLELFRHPLNKKIPAVFTERYQATNPLCGDEVELFITWGEGDKVASIGWQGEGCAISQAATSFVTEYAKGKTSDELRKITPELLCQELGLEKLNPTRLRCLSLALVALKKNNAD